MKVMNLLLLCLFISVGVSAQNYRVQVAAFETQVSSDYFSNLDIGTISHEQDLYQLHRYYTKNYSDFNEAKQIATTARAKGFNAYVVDIATKINGCCMAPPVRSTPVTDDPLYLESIFFGFDKSNITAKASRKLDNLYNVLMKYPQYNTKLSAHTDSKGSQVYNDALSQRRADAAKAYLMRKGIPASRLFTAKFGENDPIAKNESSAGSDAPEGRAFNRRVVLSIVDSNGNPVGGVVQKIDVPDDLRN